jgi:hypothetical protein
MISRQEIINDLEHLLDMGRPQLVSRKMYDVVLKIFDYVQTKNEGDSISYGELRALTDCDDIALLQSLQYLAGDKAKVFEVECRFRNGGESYLVSKNPILRHPLTGKLVSLNALFDVENLKDACYFQWVVLK